MAPLNQKLTVNATGGQFVFNVGKACTITSDNVEINGSPENSATYDKGQFMWQGMFYADEAGIWAFAGSYDDYLGLEIDGEWVLDTTSWNVVNLGTKELSVGWHDFRVIQYQNGGGWGCPVAGWKDVMNLGFRKSSNNGLYKMSSLNTYNVAATPTFSGSTHQFDGWFFVKATMAGDWTVNVNYDDQGDLWIDDVDIGADGAKAAATVVTVNGITPGWHKFKLRVADNAGNWGPWSNAGTCVTVNGNAYKFDESAFSFSLIRPAEYAGLDGVVTLNAGSTLSNDQTVDACPIWGTLKGTGSLVGRFAFAGEKNCWELTGTSNRRNLAAAAFVESEVTALAGLKKIKRRRKSWLESQRGRDQRTRPHCFRARIRRAQEAALSLFPSVVRLRLQRCGPPARRLPHRRPFTAPPATKDSNQNFFLFARMAEYAGKADCPSQFRLRSCRLSQGEVLVRDGQLLMRFADPTIPLRAVWTGHGARGMMSDTQNWNCYTEEFAGGHPRRLGRPLDISHRSRRMRRSTSRLRPRFTVPKTMCSN